MSLTIVLTLIPNVPFVQPAIFCIRKTKYFHDCDTELSYYVYVNFILFAVFVGWFVRSFVCLFHFQHQKEYTELLLQWTKITGKVPRKTQWHPDTKVLGSSESKSWSSS